MSQRLIDRMAAAVAQADPSIARRIETDPQAHLDLVVLTAQADAATGQLLRSAVAAARAAGWSWQAVGASLGMTRQAAHQRFGSNAVRAREADTGDQRRLVGVATPNEVEVLDLWGTHGWRSIGAGPGYHDLEHTNAVWRHERAFVGSRRIRTLEKDGWQQIGGAWFPWVYLVKSIDAEPLPGTPQ